MRTPDEIKYGLHCLWTDCSCKDCGFDKKGCVEQVNKDALALIEQLENQIRDILKKVPKWMNDDGSILCPYCGTTMRMIPAWQKSIPDMGGYMWAARGKCPACGSITPEMHGRTAKEANAAAYAAAQWGHMPQLEEHIRDNPKKVEAQSGTDMNVPRWISVEERLPTSEDASANELVICVCRGEDDKPIAEEVHAWHFDVVRRMAPCFTHWMPMNQLFSLLPEPPKEDT